MKKIMIFLLILIIFSVKDVLAQSQYQLTLERQDGIYFSRKGVNYNDDSNVYYIYRFGNMYAYCMQPGKHITTYNYLGMDNFVDLKLSDEVKEKLELIGYFGRDYPGHDNVLYSMATQALIWELTGVDSVSFWTEKDEKGKEIDISKEKEEILRLVNNHLLTPNVDKNITANLNEEIVISDTNKVLEGYEITNNGGNEVNIIDNSLHIIPKVLGESMISLKYTTYDTAKTIIFVGKETNDTQIMGRLRLSTEKVLDIKLNTKGVKISVQKVDEEGNKVNKEGIRFKIKDIKKDNYLCENDVCEYQTNSEGLFISKELDNGEYEIEEVLDQEIEGYVINKNKVNVTIDKDTKYEKDVTNHIDKTFVNKRIKGKLEFTKEDLTTSEGISDTIIEIYDLNDKLLFTETTDENGQVIIDNLLYGKYYIIEKEANTRYQITNEKVYFEIKEDGEIAKAKMTNEKKVIKVPKTDTEEDIIVHSLCIISLLIGLGRLLYERKKTT